MNRKDIIKPIALAILTWLFIYGLLYLLGVRRAKLVTFIIMILNLILFPFALEYIYTGSTNIVFSLQALMEYTILFFIFGPLSLLVNARFLYLMFIGG